MNIEQILRKLSENKDSELHQIPSNSSLRSTNRVGRQIRTSQSIGTLNSVTQQNERSFVIQQENYQSHQEKQIDNPNNNVSIFSEQQQQNKPILKNKQQLKTINESNNTFRKQKPKHIMRLQSQLDEIDHLKYLYESRQKRYYRSIESQKQKSSTKKSQEKLHLLKPSNTPSFHKYTKPNLNSSQIVGQTVENVRKRQNHNRTITQSYQTQKNDNFYSYPSAITKKQISPLKIQPKHFSRQNWDHSNQQYSGSFQNADDPHQQVPDFEIQQQSQRGYTKHSNSKKLDKKKSEINNKSKDTKRECGCNCKQRDRKYQEFFMKITEKFDFLTSRIDNLENQYGILKQQNSKLEQANKDFLLKTYKAQQEKAKLNKQCQTYRNQKQSLELILKDVLFKRQKQKMQSIKENNPLQTVSKNSSSKQLTTNNDRSSSRNLLFMDLKSKGKQNNSRQSSASKMKVQNLLQKLQIKVQKS